MSEVRPIRVEIADDSAVMRRLLSQVLQAEPDLDVVASARTGLEAVELFRDQNPDLLLMDVEMPLMSGLEAVGAVRTHDPDVPILMFSSGTASSCEATISALFHGATDFILKPPRTGSVSEAVSYIRRELLPRVRVLGRQAVHRRHRAESSPGRTPRRGASGDAAVAPTPTKVFQEWDDQDGFEVLLVGASTGGPQALATLLSGLPADFSVPILVAQHLPPGFGRVLAETLDHRTELNVRLAEPHAELQPGQVWIGPGDSSLSVRTDGQRRFLHLEPHTSDDSRRATVDALFRSAAHTFGKQTAALVLTGIGCDGLVGSHAVREAGGLVLAQDESTSTVWGMPRAVSIAGLAHRVVPLRELGAILTQHLARTCQSATSSS